MKFVIFADSFDDRSGGNIVLHLLCRRLQEAGESASLWPAKRPRFQLWRSPKRYLSWLRYYLTRKERRFNAGPFASGLARSADLKDSIVVYPEVVAGNPLKGHKIVRWLLHRPGFHTGAVEFGEGDLFFYYQDAFYDPSLGEYRGNRLTISWLNEVYQQVNYGERSGSCYLLKKGRRTQFSHELTGSVQVDTLSHEEKASVFNHKKYFYTYDPYTMYSRYAAICGCIPIIVPQPGMTREQWVPVSEDRYGLAYGTEDVDWAVRTRQLMLRRIALEQAAEEDMVRSFVDKCRARFA